MKNKRQIAKRIKYLAVYIYALLVMTVGICTLSLPERLTVSAKEITASPVLKNVSGIKEGESYTLSAKLFGAIPLKDIDVDVLPEMSLIPCGDVFGVKFFTKGVIVIGSTEIETENGYENPSESAGIQKSDIITKVNGKEINTVEALAGAVEKSKGKPLFIEYTRKGEVLTTEITPVLSLSDKRYKTGIWVRDSTAGIGTLTYYNPENGYFAGLGHGICDIDTSELMPLLRGSVVKVGITDIQKGKSGMPGELKGIFGTEKVGALIGNTVCGVYGILDTPPENLSKPLPIADRSEVHEGDALVLSNPDGKGVKEYKAKLSKVNNKSDGTKSFVIEITDPTLIELTGGIVQGMSGSPIIQDGKLAGAVTHVLVGNPLKGYGIFLQNMLMQMPEIMK